MLIILVWSYGAIYIAHVDGSILSISSDASVYYKEYSETYRHANILESWRVFIRASTLLLMIIFEGNLFVVLSINMAVMLLAIYAGLRCFSTTNAKMLFLICAFALPYFSLGFLSLNKEIYAMSSAIFFAAYMCRGRYGDIVMSLVLALAARYYMLAAILFTLLAFPRTGNIRYLMIVAVLAATSIAAPLVRTLIPEYSYENLVENSGSTAVILSHIVENFGYAILYPVKYGLLLVTRPYSYLSGSTNDAIGAIVSMLSLSAAALAFGLITMRARLRPIVQKLIIAGFVAPVPIMWTEIMHWRYFSFVYFFFVFAIILQLEDDYGPSGRHVVHHGTGKA